MKPIIAGALATIVSLGLLTGCGNDLKVTVPTAASTPSAATLPTDGSATTGLTLPAGLTIPDNITIPAAGSLPSDLSIPEAAIDQMLTQMAAAGMNIDKVCFTALLKDSGLRKLVEAGGTPTPEVLAKFIACVKQ